MRKEEVPMMQNKSKGMLETGMKDFVYDKEEKFKVDLLALVTTRNRDRKMNIT
jgi:hypothetical protein